jgi:lipopolysaccharide biosynthesis glycosyltransferase
MKNAIVQIYIDLDRYEKSNLLPKFDDISNISISLAKRYAEKINCDHILITEPTINFIHPTYERFTLFEDEHWTNTYDNVLYLDSDVFIYNDAPNIFEMYPNTDKFKVCTHWDEYRFGNTDAKFNAGVFMLNKKSKDIMLPFLKYKMDPPFKHHDNDALIECVENSNVPVEKMNVMFNAKNYEHAWFCHSWGSTKRKWPDSEHILRARRELENVDN